MSVIDDWFVGFQSGAFSINRYQEAIMSQCKLILANVRACNPSGLLKPVLAAIVGMGLLTGCSPSPTESSASLSSTAPLAWQKPNDKVAADYFASCEADHTQIREQMKAFSVDSKRYEAKELLSAINDIDLLLDKQMNLASLYANVHPNEAVRVSAEECEQKFVELVSEISLSRPLYNHLVAVEIDSLDALDKRLVEHLLRDFKRAGVDKDEATRNRIKKLNEEINLLYVAITRTKNKLLIPQELIPASFQPIENSQTITVLSIPSPEELLDPSYEALGVPETSPKKAYTVEEFRTRHQDAYKPWTVDFDSELSELVAGGTKVKELSAHFGRTSGAIRSRIKKLNLRE